MFLAYRSVLGTCVQLEQSWQTGPFGKSAIRQYTTTVRTLPIGASMPRAVDMQYTDVSIGELGLHWWSRVYQHQHCRTGFISSCQMHHCTWPVVQNRMILEVSGLEKSHYFSEQSCYSSKGPQGIGSCEIHRTLAGSNIHGTLHALPKLWNVIDNGSQLAWSRVIRSIVQYCAPLLQMSDIGRIIHISSETMESFFKLACPTDQQWRLWEWTLREGKGLELGWRAVRID